MFRSSIVALIVMAFLLDREAYGQGLPPIGAGSAPSTAPATPSTAPQGTVADQIPEVIVYAQKRASGETEQSVPIALTAITAQTLSDTHSISIADIGALSPNVQTTGVGTTPGFPNFSIRGVGVNSSLRTVDPAVNVVQDGMTLAYQAGAMASTFDLESVEVLRGPQGVLFGRNATGGAISVRTRLPSDQFQLMAEATAGNFGETDFATSVEGQMGSSAALGKLAVMYRTNSGDIVNTNDGIFRPAIGNPSGDPVVHTTKNLDSVDELILKPTFLFRPAAFAELTLFTQYEKFNDGGGDPRNFVPPGSAPTQLQTVYGFTPTAPRYQTNDAYPGYVHLQEDHVIAELNIDAGPGKWTTIGGWRYVIYDSTINLTGSPFLLFLFTDNLEHNTEYSFESRYNLPVTRNMDVSAGLFYLDSNSSVAENRTTTGPASAPLKSTYYSGQFRQSNNAYAGFANIDYRITDRFGLSAGGRYSTETKDIVLNPVLACIGIGFGSCPDNPFGRDAKWSNFSPRAVLTFEQSDLLHYYISYTKGFRSGNFNARATGPSTVGPADPETVTSYELGAKTEFLDRKLRVNAAIYQENYTNIQEVTTSNIPNEAPQQTLLNAAAAKIKGLELENTWLATSHLEFQANLGLTNAKFDSFNPSVIFPASVVGTNLEFAKIPKTTVYAAATYRTPAVILRGDLQARISYDWRSSFYTDFLNTPLLKEDSYGLTDMSVAYHDDAWDISLFVKNLGNVDYSDVKGVNFAYVEWGGQPRTYGVRVAYRLH